MVGCDDEVGPSDNDVSVTPVDGLGAAVGHDIPEKQTRPEGHVYPSGQAVCGEQLAAAST